MSNRIKCPSSKKKKTIKQKKLKLVKPTPSETKESSKEVLPLNQVCARNFWNTCPRKLEKLPKETCPLGKQSSEIKLDEQLPCDWCVKSDKYHYCFWKFVQNNSTLDGKMDVLLQNEIAELFGCSSTKIHFILKRAIEKLKESPHLPVLKEFFKESSSPSQGDDLFVERLIDSNKSSYDS